MTQDGRRESDRFRGGMRGCAEMPAIWREVPRPAERFAGADCLNREQPFAAHEHFQPDAAMINQVKILCDGIRLENRLAHPEPHVARTFFKDVEIIGI